MTQIAQSLPLTKRNDAAIFCADVTIGRWPMFVILSMLLMSSLPDAMVVPMLKDLFITRYGVSAAAAHWFMAVNLIGVMAAIPLLARIRKLLPPAAVLALAAALDAVLLGAMSLSIGFVGTLALRIVEGATDLLVFAVLFDLIGKAGDPTRRARRFGIAGTMLMLGLAFGVGIGGIIGAREPLMVFWCGGGSMIVVALATARLAPWINGLVRSCPAAGAMNQTSPPQLGPIWPALTMTFSDRLVAGLLVATIPLYLAETIGLSPTMRGLLLAVPLGMMALGGYPAGLLSDRFGHVQVRTMSALIYAIALAGLVLLVRFDHLMPAFVIMIAIGLGGTALLPTSMAIISRSARGSVAMGAYQAAGSFGFFTGVVSAGVLLWFFMNQTDSDTAYAWVISVFAATHVLCTVVATLGLTWPGVIRNIATT